MRYGDVTAKNAIAAVPAAKKIRKSRMRAPATNSIASAVASNTMAAPKSGSASSAAQAMLSTIIGFRKPLKRSRKSLLCRTR